MSVILWLVEQMGKTPKSARREALLFRKSSLQKKFKHAEDFGIKGNYNKPNAARLKSAIEMHIFDNEATPISGTYRGIDVIHYLNPKTGLNAIVDSTGQFHSGWKLSLKQLQHVLATGKLGGG